MNIGTPLTNNSTKVLLCGSGELGKEVAIELQRYGCEVIAIDRYDNAPAMQVAHRSYSIDMLDEKALRSIIEKEKPNLIVPEVEGGSGSLSFDWYVNGELSFVDSPTMFLFAENAGFLEYEMVVTDDCDNVVSYFFNVEIVNCGSPNVFTPNGDGNNDYFWFDFGTLSDGEYMEIYNRWGDVVFSSADYSRCAYDNQACWDGTYFNRGEREKCPDGVYFYKLKYNNQDFEIHDQNGYNIRNNTSTKTGYVLITR